MDSDLLPELQICSKSKCKNVLPHDSTWKTCERCREYDKINAAARRKRKREAQPEEPRPAPPPPLAPMAPTVVARTAGNNAEHPIAVESDSSEGIHSRSYKDSQSLFMELRRAFKTSKVISFYGHYTVLVDPLMNEREQVKMTAFEIWKITGYRFKVKDHFIHNKTRFWCCQDVSRKQKARPSQKEGVKHRDTVGMKCFDCYSTLVVSCCQHTPDDIDQRTLSIHIEHHDSHTPYFDITMPAEATEIICNNLEWSIPSTLVPRIQGLFSNITSKQVHSAWSCMSQILWKKDENQLTSAKLLLDELAGDKVDNTNSKHLELYSVLGEFDNAGFPLSYCLLSTATSIEIGKCTTALRKWAQCLRDKYGVVPAFVHVDKDMAEISMSKKRLSKSKLTTTPYKAARAHKEFSFIDVNFRPSGTSDPNEHEGGMLIQPDKTQDDTPVPTLAFHIPNPSQFPSQPLPDSYHNINDRKDIPTGLKIIIKIPKQEPQSGDIERSRHTFCSSEFREHVIEMMERHFCAHPLIPGYSHPSAAGIRQWAVRQMYTFCREHDLCELWAYLWENWYKKGRFELWARSAGDKIPQLKTTMIMESHWRHIKIDYLTHFSKPRVDLLIWILVVKLAPTYYKKIDHLLNDFGRFQELSSW
ncbi:uncharacterized protein EDB93DRAFT_1241918 [Suillus bovinus]|uniref:uncharacterized protein n=1 Tax=Suillus bovinus TaxID=48563 RepID=UPI001B8689C2|nr:uncharacterized protein EDB93DRAFT_1241918 [Suillus bovinus]KAG2139796.1 hypothetical protein EDB93DRAFT_1241918 [Suillus bovinus]